MPAFRQNFSFEQVGGDLLTSHAAIRLLYRTELRIKDAARTFPSGSQAERLTIDLRLASRRWGPSRANAPIPHRLAARRQQSRVWFVGLALQKYL